MPDERRKPDFSDPIVVLEVWHLDGTVTREVYDRRRGLFFVGWRTERRPEPPRRWMPWSRWFFSGSAKRKKDHAGPSAKS